MLCRRAPLRLQQLEARDTPATIVNSGGTLTVTNNRGALVFTQQANGTFNVTDNGVNNGTYAVTNGITATTGNLNDSVSVSLATGKTLPGTLTINTGNGDDSVIIDGNGTGRIGGNLKVDTGNGFDHVSIGITSGVIVSGASSIGTGAGTDTVQISVATFNSTVAIAQANLLEIGVADTTIINGSLSINNSADYGIANTTTLGTTSLTVAGSTAYAGGSGTDAVTIAANAQLGIVANTSVVVNVGSGDSTLVLSGKIGDASNSGNFTFIGANNYGTDSLTVNGSTSVVGNLTLNVGEGSITYNLTGNFFVGGNFTLNAGSEDDNVGVINADISGNVSVSLGSGNDTINFGATDGVFGTAVGSIGGTLFVDAGDGTDSIGLAVNVGSTATIQLGAGADTFTATDPDAFYGAATIDLGVDAISDLSTIRSGLAPLTTYLNVGGLDTTATV